MPAGRKSKFTPEVVKKITDAIRIGTTYELAAAYAGISFETFSQWRKAKPEFSEALREAEATGLVGWLAKIEQAASAGDWRAAAWKAERRYPQQYGKTVSEVQGKDGSELTVRIQYADISPAPPALGPATDSE